MHPNPLFRSEDKAQYESLIENVGFGMVFLTTPDGPRVAHTPVLSDGQGRLRFHLANGNALTRHLDGADALLTVNGPDGYISPRWYDDRNTVPTWDYVALEMDGPVRKLDVNELDAFLYALIEKHEGRLGGEQWSSSETDPAVWNRLLDFIAGFEMTVENWRPTFKLSQKKSAAERLAIAAGLDAAGKTDLSRMMRETTA